METKTLASLFAIVSMLVIMTWTPVASAGEIEGTETVDEDYYWAQQVSFFTGDYFTLSYTITVENDVYIDVMLLNEENYNKYKNRESFTYYTEGTDFNTIYTKVYPPLKFYDHDNYYIVVDNTDNPSNGAMPPWDGVNTYCTFHYTASTEIHTYSYDTNGDGLDEEVFPLIGALCVIGIVGIIAVVIIAVALFIRKKGGQQTSPYQPQYQQQPYYRDQQPPPPPDYRPPQ